MPPKKRRKFKRPSGKRRYRKMFVLATEGSKTESQYFAIFNDQNLVVHIKFLKGGYSSAPPQVLARMRDHLEKEDLKNSDEAWLVVDKDQWTDDQLSQLHEWAQEADNYGFALSNPKFEFWLLLHFEDGNSVSNSQTCSKRLERYLPGYDKDISVGKISGVRFCICIARKSFMVVEICYMKSKYVEFPYIFFFNVENRSCGLERESDSKNLRNRQSQLWKRYQTTVDSGGVGNLTPEDSSALLLVGNES